MDVVNGIAVPVSEEHAVVENPDLPPVPPVKKLSREELLECENLYLRVTNLALQEKQLQQDLIKCNQMKIDFQKQLDDLRTKLGSKYGVDMKSPEVAIAPDGTITIGQPARA